MDRVILLSIKSNSQKGDVIPNSVKNNLAGLLDLVEYALDFIGFTATTSMKNRRK